MPRLKVSMPSVATGPLSSKKCGASAANSAMVPSVNASCQPSTRAIRRAAAGFT